MTSRLAIAGSTSLLGRALRRRAEQAGWQVTLLGRSAEADVRFDARSAETPELPPCDALVNCAASFRDDDPAAVRELFEVNVQGAVTLLEAGARAGLDHCLYVSSTSALDPRGGYGISKAAAEAVLAQLCAKLKIRLTVVRPSQIYDATGEAARRQPFLYALAEKIAAGETVTLNGRRDVLRNYVHVDDVAEAVFRTVREGLEGVFNAVHPESLAVSEAARRIGEAAGREARVRFDPAKPDLADIVIPQDDNLFGRLGLEPRDLGQGLGELFARMPERTH